MSQENVDHVRRGWEHMIETGEFLDDLYHPDFVLDLSTYAGWTEQQTYEGVDGLRQFLADWLEAWEEWELWVEDVRDAGNDRVVSIVHQRGRSKAAGATVEMSYATVNTLRDGKQIRTEGYATPEEAFRAAGLSE